MYARLESMCHGDGKDYLQLVLSGLKPDGMLSMDAYLPGSPSLPIPAHLFPFRPQDTKSEANFVVVLPHYDAREVYLDFQEEGASNEPISHVRLTVEVNFAKWKSRLNSLVRPELTSQMLDIEREYCADRMNVYFSEAIDDGQDIVVKMLVDMPAQVDCDMQVGFLDHEGKEYPLPVYPLVDELIPATRVGDTERLHVGFSVRVDVENKTFTAHVYDANGNIDGGFAQFCNETYEPLQKLFEAVATDATHDPAYERWYHLHCATLADLALQRQTVLPYEPLLSLIVPLFPVTRRRVAATLRSLLAQTYEKFEVVLVDACSEAEGRDDLLDAWRDDPRLVHIAIDRSADLASSALSGLKTASGEYRGVVPEGIAFAPEALFEFVRHLNSSQTRPGMLFAHHDKETPDGRYKRPIIKPVFSPDLLCAWNYLGPFIFMHEDVSRAVADLHDLNSNAFFYDLVLRAVEHSSSVDRVDGVLYHKTRLAHPTQEEKDHFRSMSEADLKASREVVEAHLERLDVSATVYTDLRHDSNELVYKLTQPLPRLCVIIPNKDQIDLLTSCIMSLTGTGAYENLEIMILENGSTDPDTFKGYEDLQNKFPFVRKVDYDGQFSLPDMDNAGTKRTRADVFLFLDNDTELLAPTMLSEMVAHAMQPSVGVVGAKLLYPDETIQHCGMVVGPFGAAGNIGVNLPRSWSGYCKRLVCASNVSAVSGSALMIRREVFEKIKGFDAKFKTAFHDVDLCLRAQEAGYYVVVNPRVEFFHYENATQGHVVDHAQRIRLERERSYLHYRWPNIFIDGDPYLSSCLDNDSLYFQLGWS